MEVISTNTIINLLYEHRYIFAFLGAFFEGTFIMILAGVLYKFGYFKFWGLMAALFSGYFLNGIAWYLIGRCGGNRILEKWGRRLHITKNLLEKLEDYFKNHSVKTIFITRITWGFSMVTFIIAGAFKMNFKKFLIVSIAASIVWISATLGLGYIFGASYRALGVITRSIAIGLNIVFFVIIVLISILIVYWLKRFARTKFMKKITKNNQFQFLHRISEAINNLVNGKK